MSNIKIFSVAPGGALEIPGEPMSREKDLQQLCEANLQTLFGVRLVQSEFKIGQSRIDTVALGAGNCPVLLEYKRRADAKVISQSLSYMTELHDRPDSLWKAVSKQFGQEAADGLDWKNSYIICVAAEFPAHAIKSVGGVIWKVEFFQYRMFGQHTLMLERMKSPNQVAPHSVPAPKPPRPSPVNIKPYTDHKSIKTDHLQFEVALSNCSVEFRNVVGAIRRYLASLGSDVMECKPRRILSFRRTEYFASLQIRPRRGKVLVYANVHPGDAQLQEGFTVDMSKTSHEAKGRGDLQITICNQRDLERAKPLLRRAYEES